MGNIIWSETNGWHDGEPATVNVDDHGRLVITPGMEQNADLSESEWADTVEAARKEGADDGRAAGTWVFDGNTIDETYQKWARMLDDGDPEVWDHYRAPLSGEYADDLTPRALVESLGLVDESLTNEERAELCDAYETAHQDAWRAEVERVAKLQTEGEVA